ncbi:MAG: hypothetical protein EZS28_009046 [Streblomastix strix]|uniref:Uncharacterized protein n=1 Tax=Streblomastix strix TaxID=222440 RepID=A0A5J4WK52_9EUKA|nr:MAG: hypothetical protein EZS28_009046 [Streblomastix strix]
MIIIEARIKDLTLKILPQPNADNIFRLDVADGAITMNDEADAIRFLRFIRKPTQSADPDANSLNHERKIDAFKYGIKKKYFDEFDEILKTNSLIGDLTIFTPFDDSNSQVKLKQRNLYPKLEQRLMFEGM